MLRATMLQIVIGMFSEIDLLIFQKLRCWCFTHPLFFCHGNRLLRRSSLLRRVAHHLADGVNRLEHVGQ